MAGKDVERRLAAILSADVVGYSRLMGEDDAGTLSALKTLRKELFAPTVAESIAHCRRLRNFARTLNPIYSDNASTKSTRIRPSTSPKSRPSNEIG